jgi:hypothetical protein
MNNGSDKSGVLINCQLMSGDAWKRRGATGSPQKWESENCVARRKFNKVEGITRRIPMSRACSSFYNVPFESFM